MKEVNDVNDVKDVNDDQLQEVLRQFNSKREKHGLPKSRESPETAKNQLCLAAPEADILNALTAKKSLQHKIKEVA